MKPDKITLLSDRNRALEKENKSLKAALAAERKKNDAEEAQLKKITDRYRALLTDVVRLKHEYAGMIFSIKRKERFYESEIETLLDGIRVGDKK